MNKKLGKPFILLTFIFILTCLLIGAVSAVNIHVNTTGDDINGDGSADKPFQTIQKGVDGIADDDTVIIADGTYTGTGNNNILIDHSITVQGQSQTGTIINGAGNQIFNIPYGYNVIIKNLTITASNRAIYNVGTLTVNDCTLTGNTAHFAGAIYNRGTCTLNDCTLTGNTANHDDGGAIWNDGTLTANNCNFNGNTAHSSNLGGGGAICNYDGTLTANNCNFNGNTAGDQWGSGGAICNYNAGTLYVIGCNFNGNSASGSDFGNGGAIFNRDGYCSVTNSIFTDNTAHLTAVPKVNYINFIDMYMSDGYGGDICNGANLDVINCIFNGNHAVNIPGGMFNVFGVVTNFNLNRILGNTEIMGFGGTINWGINWYVPASLIVTITGPTTVNAGNSITYTITVTNNGQGHADNVQIQDIIPTILQNVIHDSFNLGTINEGSSKTVTITGTVPSSVTQGTIIENSATVTSRTPATITPSNIIRTIIYVIKTNPLIKKRVHNTPTSIPTNTITGPSGAKIIANLISPEGFKTGNNYVGGGWSYIPNNMAIAGVIIVILAAFGVLVALKRK